MANGETSNINIVSWPKEPVTVLENTHGKRRNQ